jgi:hypothetical protein
VQCQLLAVQQRPEEASELRDQLNPFFLLPYFQYKFLFYAITEEFSRKIFFFI